MKDEGLWYVLLVLDDTVTMLPFIICNPNHSNNICFKSVIILKDSDKGTVLPALGVMLKYSGNTFTATQFKGY